jgi:hypothetical protein
MIVSPMNESEIRVVNKILSNQSIAEYIFKNSDEANLKLKSVLDSMTKLFE